LVSDGSQRHSVGIKGSGLLPAANTSGPSCSRSLLRWSRRQRRRGRHDDWFGRFDLHALDLLAATSASHDLIQRCTHVLHQMEPVGNLNGAGRTAASSIGVGSPAIADHYLNTGMGLQPFDQWFGIASGKHVDGLVSLQVDQHGGIACPTAQREIIDTQHARRRNWRQAQHLDQS
jgi:hypothetical protein